MLHVLLVWFLLLSREPLYMYTSTYSMQSPINGHLSFQFGAITNKADINIHMQVLWGTYVFVSLG